MAIARHCNFLLNAKVVLLAAKLFYPKEYRVRRAFNTTLPLITDHRPLTADHSPLTASHFPPSAVKPGGSELRELCASLDGLATVAPERLQLWLGKLVVSLADRGDETSAGRNERLESQQLLQSLTAYLVREDR